MLFGDKSEAIFDIWSCEHILTGIMLTYLLTFLFPRKKSNLEMLLILSLTWECIEHYLEEGLLGNTIKNWFAGTEYWANRIIGDNCMMILGYFIYIKWKKCIYIALFLGSLFLYFHLTSTSSMDIQKFLF